MSALAAPTCSLSFILVAIEKVQDLDAPPAHLACHGEGASIQIDQMINKIGGAHADPEAQGSEP